MGSCCSKPKHVYSTHTVEDRTEVTTYKKSIRSSETWSFDGDPDDRQNLNSNGDTDSRSNNGPGQSPIHGHDIDGHANNGFDGTDSSNESVPIIDDEIDTVSGLEPAKVDAIKVHAYESTPFRSKPDEDIGQELVSKRNDPDEETDNETSVKDIKTDNISGKSTDAVNSVSNGNTTSGYESDNCIRKYEDDEDRIKNKIISHNYRFIREKIIPDEVCDKLVSKDIIQTEESEYIMSEKTMTGRADLLLQTLLQKPKFGKTEFDGLVCGLKETKQYQCVDQLNAPLDIMNGDENDDLAERIGRHYTETDIDMIADQIDTLTIAPLCLERGSISIHDYVNIFPRRHERKLSAKIIIQCVIENQTVLQKFKDILIDGKCLEALKLLEKFNTPDHIKRDPYVQVQCACINRKITVSKSKGCKVVLSMENGVDEITIKAELSKTTTMLCNFKANTNCEFLKAENGSIVIYLKTYDNSFMQQLHDSSQEQFLLCNLIRSIIGHDEIARNLQDRHFQVKLTIDEDDVDRSILGETMSNDHSIPIPLTPKELLVRQRKLLCRELNPHKYRTYIVDKGILALEDIPFSDQMSREEKMDYLMKRVFIDESMCDHLFKSMEENESPDLYQAITWNGSSRQIAFGIRHNFKYLVDELVPAKIIPAIKARETDDQEFLQMPTLSDRRVCCVSLLRIVINGSGQLIRSFYDALCETHPLEFANRIRRSAFEYNNEVADRQPIVQLSLPTKSTRLFEGEFTVQIELDHSHDSVQRIKDDVARFSGNQHIMKYNSDNQLKTGNANLNENFPRRDVNDPNYDTFYKSDIYKGLDIGGTDNWESNVFAIRIRPYFSKCFYFNPLKSTENAVVEISISDQGNDSERQIIVSKTTFKEDHSLTVQFKMEDTCSIMSTFIENCIKVKASDVVLYVKSLNMKFSERDFIADENVRFQDSDERISKQFRSSKETYHKAKTYAGKRSFEHGNVIEVYRRDIRELAKSDDDIESGNFSGTSSVRSSVNIATDFSLPIAPECDYGASDYGMQLNTHKF